MLNKGLRKHEIKRKLLVDLLIEGISEIIEENNKKLADDLLRKR